MSNAAPATAQVVLARIIQSASRHWRRLVVLAAIGAVLFGALGFVIGRGGSSTATVFVAPLEASPFSPDPRGQTVTNLETEAQVAQSDEVMDRAAIAMGGGISATQLGQALTVSIPPGAQVLTLAVTGSEGLNPQTAVDAIATSYLVVRQERTVLSVAERKKAIAASKKVAREQLRAAATKISATRPETPRRKVAEQELNVASGTMAALAQSEADLAGVSTYPGEVLSPGSDPRSRTPIVATLVGALLGLAIGLGWALLIDRRQRRMPPPQFPRGASST